MRWSPISTTQPPRAFSSFTGSAACTARCACPGAAAVNGTARPPVCSPPCASSCADAVVLRTAVCFRPFGWPPLSHFPPFAPNLYVAHDAMSCEDAYACYPLSKSRASLQRATTVPVYIIINAALPAKNFAEFVALMKANPGKYSFGTPGSAIVHHLAFETLKARLGLDVVHA